MTSDQRKKLSEIKQFKQLIAYLRDEMGWPIKSDSEFDELTYEYTTNELGIDDKSAAQIQEIKRLRPLSAKQPWGVFFVKFEPKKLPVVALRRILGQVALKKRASANPADRTMWAQEDLLFISNYGEGDDRQITLAHFSVPTGGHTLPSLKVLGWDSKDTVLHLEAVARELTEQLSWPADENDVDAWRAKWRSAFTVGHQEVITTSKALSIRLAQLARDIRDRISTALTIETADGPLTKLMKAFQESLIHDLTADDFADMYAQTIAYGLLSSRIADPKQKSVDDLTAHMRLSPFLKELMETFMQVGGRNKNSGIDFDELGIGDVTDLLDQANMEAVIADFGDRNSQEDPVIHFYELFLKEYDEDIRMSRGVFYTPRPIVSYIVRSVDEILRTEYGLTDGLADTTTWGEMANRHRDLQVPAGVESTQDFIQILDPATGTGTFLVEVIDLIFETLTKKWISEGHDDREIVELWNAYVPQHLLTRLHGYELMMAPYAIAHLKVGIKLYETGYRFGGDERARIFMTNSLEPAGEMQLTLGFLPSLAREVEAVDRVKRYQKFTVVIGNPPYFAEAGKGGSWIANLMRGRDLTDGRQTDSYFEIDGVPLKERNTKWINDDYVKFIRLAQHLIKSTGTGVQGYVTNHGYLENPTFRGMRLSLMKTFPEIRVIDLHGNAKKKELAPDGLGNENVFDIQQGVSIGLFVRSIASSQKYVLHADYWGDRAAKYQRLTESTLSSETWISCLATPPLYIFTPFNETMSSSYNHWMPINVVMPTHSSGVVTARDDFAVDLELASLRSRIVELRSVALTDQSIREKYFTGKGSNKYEPGDSRSWRLNEVRDKIRKDEQWDSHFTRIDYRPFDTRNIYYVPWMIDWPRREVMQHMVGGSNVGLVFMRQVAMGRQYSHFGVTRNIVDARMFYSNKGTVSLAPLFLRQPGQLVGASLAVGSSERHGSQAPNFAPAFIQQIEMQTSLTFTSETRGDMAKEFGPEDAFAYIYGVFNSPKFRELYDAHLKREFPRIPLPQSRKLFSEIATIGHRLVELQLLEANEIDGESIRLVGSAEPTVEAVEWAGGMVWLNKAQTVGFDGISELVWQFNLGGRQVCEAWLKERRGHSLSQAEVLHYKKMVESLSQSIGLMYRVDEVVEQCGGWPDAFLTGGGHHSLDYAEKE